RVQLIKDSLDWKWVGVVHEVVDAPNARTVDTLPGVSNKVSTDGNRATDPKRFLKDAKLLEDALAKDPNNTRNVFYLAQSYKDAQEYQKAFDNYAKRASMGGWDQEVYWSLLQMAMLQESLGLDEETIVKSYQKAYSSRPERAETLY